MNTDLDTVMRILAIETTDLRGSVALVEEQRVRDERRLEERGRSAQSLAPAIDAILRDADWHPRDVELVAVASGPGSFTGLRIGVTTAKAFAYAVGCPVVGINTLAAIAEQAGEVQLWTVMNAERGELFAAEFARDAQGDLLEVTPTFVVSADAWLASLVPGTIVSGPGLARLLDRLPPGVTVVDRERWSPTAATIGLLGGRRHTSGESGNVFSLVPWYYRRTAAEEKADEKRDA
jgi:tRNA threonylcarbamoyladenosine biosynthesis protein TsaB